MEKDAEASHRLCCLSGFDRVRSRGWAPCRLRPDGSRGQGGLPLWAWSPPLNASSFTPRPLHLSITSTLFSALLIQESFPTLQLPNPSLDCACAAPTCSRAFRGRDLRTPHCLPLQSGYRKDAGEGSSGTESEGRNRLCVCVGGGLREKGRLGLSYGSSADRDQQSTRKTHLVTPQTPDAGNRVLCCSSQVPRGHSWAAVGGADSLETGPVSSPIS